MTLCFKPHAGHAIHDPARALETLRLVSSPRLKICYDYCHMFVASESLESSLRALAPNLGFITLKDARWTDTGHQFLLPGDGDTDYPLYFRLLKELGYRGWVAAEVTAMILAKARVRSGRRRPHGIREYGAFLERWRPRAAFTETERDPVNLGGRLF